MKDQPAVVWSEDKLDDERRRVTAKVGELQVEIIINEPPGTPKWVTFSQGTVIWRMTRTSLRLDEIQRRAETWLNGGPCRM